MLRASVGNPVVWGKHVFTRKKKNAFGDRLRLIKNMRKMNNDISHSFDLPMFLTVKDILSDRQFIFSDIKRPKQACLEDYWRKRP